MAQMHFDNCFKCLKPGHFARDCPERSGAALSKCLGSSSRVMPVTTDPEFPSTHCRCGKGLCQIFVSKKYANPNRKFYRCPGTGPENCNYFKWCDELRMDQVLVSPPKLKFPTCACQAGVCILKDVQNGPNAGRSYFCCPIKKGEGACNFIMWQDHYIMTANNGQNESSTSHAESVDAHIIGAPNDCSAEVLEQLEGPGIDEASPGSSPMQLSVKHGFPGMATENVVANSSANNVEVSTPEAGGEPQDVQFKRQTATPNTPADSLEAAIRMSEDTPTVESEKRMKVGPCSTQALHKLNFIGLDPEPSFHQEDLVSGYVDEVTFYLKAKLISSLESLDPSKHEVMLDIAKHTFSAMKGMDPDFCNKVMEYISRAAILAEVEKSTPNHLSSEELKGKYDAQRSHYEAICHEKAKISSALMVKKKNLCNLQEEVSHHKEMLSAAEEKLSDCELEIVSLEACLYQISEEMEQLKQSLQDDAEALKCFNKRDIDLGAVKSAFEIARAKLHV